MIIRHLGEQPYQPIWQQMQQFTAERTAETPDEIWLLEHPAIYTLGRSASREHLLTPGDIPVLRVDRGGQVTYHGPGQLLLYLMFDLSRARLGVRRLVKLMEKSLIELLQPYGIGAHRLSGEPGIYVDGRKLASIGLRVRRGCCLHGMSINVAMDLEPFSRINPCGHRDLEVTQLKDLGLQLNTTGVGGELATLLTQHLAPNESTQFIDMGNRP
jgi:lipoyl(octanoyl) transferase